MRTVKSLSLSRYLSSSRLDCIHVLRQCHSIGKSLNDPTRRWLKAELIDKTYSMCFDKLIYKDEKGYDWTYRDQRVSGKSQARMFQRRNETTAEVKISNTMGGDSYDSYQMFDYIILTQTLAPFSIAVAKYEHVEHYFTHTNDGIKMKAPFHMLDFIIHPDEGVDFEDVDAIDYAGQVNKLIDEMLLSVLSGEPVCC